ncbi:hypothetical protein [Mucilaginibacter rubeus]|uniref:hypothetical protein n=1 Tax=Mucilaginibacter rubeus TaxID=2027860 RepID=UPI001668BB56|nr:hypothetical protein [Mucilaginibacter rubeus]
MRPAAILTAGAYDSRFELYAHEIMAAAFGIPADVIAPPAAGGGPYGLTEQDAFANNVAKALVYGRIIPASIIQTLLPKTDKYHLYH